MRCDKLIQIRAPETLAKALTAAADKQLISRSDYIRGALLDRLRVDEIDLNDVRDDCHPLASTGVAA